VSSARALLLSIVFCTPYSAFADGADAKALAALLRPVTTLSAHFTQTVLGARFELLQSAEGELHIQRPGKFRWRIVAPYPQLIVTQGDRLWVYDEDLDQVQIRPLAEAFDGTPARVLAGALDELENDFEVTRVAQREEDVFRLVRRAQGAAYRELLLHFTGGRIREIEVMDSLGQLTQVRLSNVEVNEPLDPALFTFEIPPGVDVIGEAPPVGP